MISRDNERKGETEVVPICAEEIRKDIAKKKTKPVGTVKIINEIAPPPCKWGKNCVRVKTRFVYRFYNDLGNLLEFIRLRSFEK